tara:strand:+ start:811 stop:1650 length:840 start_codon:yes stop_codon:yes gene_type:complete
MENIRIEKLDSYFKNKLNESKFYKLDFGIDNVNMENSNSLIFFAFLSGFSAIDIPANQEFIKIAKDEIIKAKQKSSQLFNNENLKCLLFTSLGINFFSNLDSNQLFEKIGYLKEDGIDVIDIHINDIDYINNIKKVDLICEFFKDKILSINLSRKRLSNIHMVDLLTSFYAHLKNKMIIEIEGIRYYSNDLNQVLQTVSTADIINKQFKLKSPKYKRIPILLGNSHKRKMENLALECNVPYNGINVDSKYLKEFLDKQINVDNEKNIESLLNQIRKIFL